MIEPVRGCGSRVVGGMYLVSDGPGYVCPKMPYNLEVCPTCGGGIHFARGWSWIDPKALTGGKTLEYCTVCGNRDRCPFENRKEGLMWVGQTFYTPESFQLEAFTLGVSKRIANVPRDFILGTTWVFLAHKKAGRKWLCEKLRKGSCKLSGEKCQGTDTGCPNYVAELREVPALFYAFCPSRIELIVTESQMAAFTDDQRKDFEKRHITLVPVPDDDPDHNPKGKGPKDLATVTVKPVTPEQLEKVIAEALGELETEKAEVAAEKADQGHQEGVDN